VAKTKIVVVGLGRLGLPLATVLSRNPDLEVWGLDTRADLIRDLKGGIVTLPEPDLDITRIEGFTADAHEAYDGAGVAFVVVNTPPTQSGGLSHDDVEAACRTAGSMLVSDPGLIALVSTVEAGPLQRLRRRAEIPSRVPIVYHPTFIALGRVVHDLVAPHFRLYGVEAGVGQIAVADRVHSWWCDPVGDHIPAVIRPMGEVAIAKVALNAWLCQQVTFGAILHDAVQAVGGDPKQALGILAHDPRFKASYASGGFPFGGPCFPKDLHSFGTMAEGLGVHGAENYVHGVWLANEAAMTRVVDKLLADPHVGSVGFAGVAYKPGTDVIERSPVIRMMQAVALRRGPGFRIGWWDPLVDAVAVRTALGWVADQTTRYGTPAALGDASHSVVLCHDTPEARAPLATHPGLVDPW